MKFIKVAITRGESSAKAAGKCPSLKGQGGYHSRAASIRTWVKQQSSTATSLRFWAVFSKTAQKRKEGSITQQ
ncbi:hypothetical protein [Rufibacter quisquiliarum]|uniref:Uncharacterized protein n=1 Tax=Rufibacter quisquiliarum TaxID=1549639 RepID=A0A839GRY3_9BACT|nr:hypothetical protein [Rufibacter quisquiliarum]MBA9076591.1 hypothetical protein [Rufibacter quisquiliarum]